MQAFRAAMACLRQRMGTVAGIHSFKIREHSIYIYYTYSPIIGALRIDLRSSPCFPMEYEGVGVRPSRCQRALLLKAFHD